MASSSSSASSSGFPSGFKPPADVAKEIEHVHNVTILGKTIIATVTNHPDGMAQWVKDVGNEDKADDDDNDDDARYIGFGAQYYNDDYNRPRMGTIQLCLDNRCLIIPLVNAPPCPTSLTQFFANPNNRFVGIDMAMMIADLRRQYPFPIADGFHHLDLCNVAAKLYDDLKLRRASQRELALRAIGQEVEKPEVDHTQWGRPASELSDKHVEYACIDAFINHEIARWLNLGRGRRG